MAQEVGTDVHVSTTRSIQSRPGIVVHRVRRLDTADVQRGLLRVTRVAGTVVDLADVSPWKEVRGAVDTLRWFSPSELRAAQRRAPGRAGRGMVTRLLEADEAHTKSELERRFPSFVRRHGLPRPTGLNVRVAGFKADCLYRDERLVVELDGRAYYQRRRQMAADRLRDEGYQLAGYRIQRFLWTTSTSLSRTPRLPACSPCSGGEGGVFPDRCMRAIGEHTAAASAAAGWGQSGSRQPGAGGSSSAASGPQEPRS